MSANLVELIRRHHAADAPTAVEQLAAAAAVRGGPVEAGDVRAVAAATGLPEATVYGIATFYDDLIAPRGRRHVRVCTGTACFAATGGDHVAELATGLGVGLGERRADGGVSLAETVCLGFCHTAPAVRDGDLIDAGTGVIDRVLAGTTRAAPEPAARSILERAGADPSRRLDGPAPRARRTAAARGGRRGA